MALSSHAFSAKMIPPGQTASGFLYFQGELKPGATLFLNGFAAAPAEKNCSTSRSRWSRPLRPLPNPA